MLSKWFEKIGDISKLKLLLALIGDVKGEQKKVIQWIGIAGTVVFIGWCVSLTQTDPDDLFDAASKFMLFVPGVILTGLFARMAGSGRAAGDSRLKTLIVWFIAGQLILVTFMMGARVISTAMQQFGVSTAKEESAAFVRKMEYELGQLRDSSHFNSSVGLREVLIAGDKALERVKGHFVVERRDQAALARVEAYKLYLEDEFEAACELVSPYRLDRNAGVLHAMLLRQLRKFEESQKSWMTLRDAFPNDDSLLVQLINDQTASHGTYTVNDLLSHSKIIHEIANRWEHDPVSTKHSDLYQAGSRIEKLLARYYFNRSDNDNFWKHQDLFARYCKLNIRTLEDLYKDNNNKYLRHVIAVAWAEMASCLIKVASIVGSWGVIRDKDIPEAYTDAGKCLETAKSLIQPLYAIKPSDYAQQYVDVKLEEAHWHELDAKYTVAAKIAEEALAACGNGGTIDQRERSEAIYCVCTIFGIITSDGKAEIDSGRLLVEYTEDEIEMLNDARSKLISRAQSEERFEATAPLVYSTIAVAGHYCRNGDLEQALCVMADFPSCGDNAATVDKLSAVMLNCEHFFDEFEVELFRPPTQWRDE